MTELVFKGKEFVYNHHLAVPHRPLVPDASKGIGPARLDGNLIVHGDNLHALKALLPLYAGKVDCIFIDPPYNTGNEGWCYSDNVSAPMIKEWLAANPVGVEDGLRHDKWCAMMWPRLRLLRELLAETGSFWMTIDDNEAHRAKLMLDEVFGDGNFVANVVWQKRYTRSNNTDNFTSVVDQILVYQKSAYFTVNLTKREDAADNRYSNPDDDPRGAWKSTPFLNQVPPERRPNLCYPIVNPNTGEVTNPTSKAWRNDRATYQRLLNDNRFWWGTDGKKPVPRIKTFLSEVKPGLAPVNLWKHEFAGHTDHANGEIKSIFGDKIFETPKPTALLRRILEHAADENALVLDSFAGSGTTAHAVLEANKRDGGSRRFILVEMEDYADSVTAERVRRVVNGYDFAGTKRTELLRKNLSWTSIKNADELTHDVAALDNLHGHEYDRIGKQVKNGELIVTGETDVAERTAGLGGQFTYCDLGAPIELDKILSGDDLPDYSTLGTVLFHMATNHTLEATSTNALNAKTRNLEYYLGEADGRHVWLLYRPDLEWLKSSDAALTLNRAHEFAATDPPAQHLVFAPARYVSNKMLNEHNLPVEFVPLPYALYRIDKSE